jgi:hypothetical protein
LVSVGPMLNTPGPAASAEREQIINANKAAIANNHPRFEIITELST